MVKLSTLIYYFPTRYVYLFLHAIPLKVILLTLLIYCTLYFDKIYDTGIV